MRKKEIEELLYTAVAKALGVSPASQRHIARRAAAPSSRKLPTTTAKTQARAAA